MFPSLCEIKQTTSLPDLGETAHPLSLLFSRGICLQAQTREHPRGYSKWTLLRVSQDHSS